MGTSTQRKVVEFPSAITRFTSVAGLPLFLRVDELCVILDIGRDEGYRFAKQHGEKVGRCWRVSRAVIERMTTTK